MAKIRITAQALDRPVVIEESLLDRAVALLMRMRSDEDTLTATDATAVEDVIVALTSQRARSDAIRAMYPDESLEQQPERAQASLSVLTSAARR